MWQLTALSQDEWTEKIRWQPLPSPPDEWLQSLLSLLPRRAAREAATTASQTNPTHKIYIREETKHRPIGHLFIVIIFIFVYRINFKSPEYKPLSVVATAIRQTTVIVPGRRTIRIDHPHWTTHPFSFSFIHHILLLLLLLFFFYHRY